MDKVHLNEEVDLSKWTRHPEQGKYTLYGFVVHQGERTSGRFYSVLRPAGPGGKWFSFRETSENKIACLTSKEVKAAAEGPGPESVKATKPPGDVPYVALYVRTDVVSEFLKPELEPWEAPRSFRKAVLDYLPEGTKVEEDPEDYSRVTCEIYNSEIFKDHVGRGVFNAWDAGLRAKFPEKVLSINFSADTKISLLRWKLYKLLGLEKSEQVRLWPMTQLPSLRISILRLHGLIWIPISHTSTRQSFGCGYIFFPQARFLFSAFQNLRFLSPFLRFQLNQNQCLKNLRPMLLRRRTREMPQLQNRRLKMESRLLKLPRWSPILRQSKQKEMPIFNLRLR
jgi:hypothetical protein